MDAHEEADQEKIMQRVRFNCVITQAWGCLLHNNAISPLLLRYSTRRGEGVES